MECKFLRYSLAFAKAFELIDTLWNVNPVHHPAKHVPREN